MSQQPQLISSVDPYVYQTLISIEGRLITVQTTNGSLQGMLESVMPAHIVLQVNETPFFVRIQQIVWVFPN
ncbi:YuzF family protein [Guptibacillus hwajinpoensis]|uniref:YuzF family protein n=1 Tax=Guptibacillus hwajinpoensis TaxID=208199 RepID=UPI001CFDE052|nr:YuzF family protein [Pseudalkalibacillus hwajinpoensis]WLR58327.1 YuzF family protein [Pseudalkalibacillus hwajinpoensis]